jgi:hypothetical protein
VRRWHPDFDGGIAPDTALSPANTDAAVDFVDMSAVVDRIHAAFFHNGR